jgi:hypothetical protein
LKCLAARKPAWHLEPSTTTEQCKKFRFERSLILSSADLQLKTVKGRRSRIDWWRLLNTFLVPGWPFYHLVICQIFGISNRHLRLWRRPRSSLLSARNHPMIQPAKYRCIHLFSCLHDGGRRGSRSAAGRPKNCSESRNLQKVIGSSSSNPQTSRPDEQEQDRNAKPCHQSHRKPVRKVHRLCLNGLLSIFLSRILKPKFISIARPFCHPCIRQSLRILMPTKPAAWSIQPVIEAQVTAESTANRQHPSFDCLSRRHQLQEWLMGLNVP